MTEKELRMLGRSELINVVIEQEKEIDELKTMLKDANRTLEARNIKIANAGSLAEASVMISGVLEAAQSAADIYLDNIRDTDGMCKRMQEEAEARSKKIIEDAEKAAEQAKSEAKAETDRYWNEVSSKLESFYNEHNGLRDLLNFTAKPRSDTNSQDNV